MIIVGDNATNVANAAVIEDVPYNAVVAEVLARVIGENIDQKMYAERRTYDVARELVKMEKQIVDRPEKIRVLEVNVDDQDFGGVYVLIKNLIVHGDAGLQIDIAAIEQFVHSENVQELESYGSKVHYVGYTGSKWKKQIVCYRNLKALLRRERYDFVHIHADVANKLLVSGLAAKHAGISNIVLHSHSSGVEGGNRKAKMVFHKSCRRLLKRIGTQFVACSSEAAEWMFPNIKEDQIAIINNGIDLEKFRFDPKVRAKVRKELGIADELLLGHVGRFGYQKNHEYLLKIMREIKNEGVKAKLLLVGQGPREAEIRRLAAQEEVEDVILFYGISKRVNELMQAMDIFLLPSRFEGLPIVGVEAQASGLPAIFSDRITREVALSKNVRFLTIDENAVSQWAGSIQEFEEQPRQDNTEYMREKGFDIENTVSAFETLYWEGRNN